MSTETDLIKLYSQRILALAADIPLTDRLDTPQATVRKRAPLCGSTVTVDLDIDRWSNRPLRSGREGLRAWTGLCRADGNAYHWAAPAPRWNRAATSCARLLKDGAPPPEAPFTGYDVLEPARDYKNRHASIMLAFDATAQAMAEAEGRRLRPDAPWIKKPPHSGARRRRQVCVSGNRRAGHLDRQFQRP